YQGCQENETAPVRLVRPPALTPPSGASVDDVKCDHHEEHEGRGTQGNSQQTRHEGDSFRPVDEAAYDGQQTGRHEQGQEVAGTDGAGPDPQHPQEGVAERGDGRPPCPTIVALPQDRGVVSPPARVCANMRSVPSWASWVAISQGTGKPGAGSRSPC